MPPAPRLGLFMALLVAGAAALPAPARADNGLAAISQSTKSIGRGGAGAAAGGDVLSATANPALLIDAGPGRAEVSVGLALDRVRQTNFFKDRLVQTFARSPHPAVGVAWDPSAPGGAEGGASDLRVGFSVWLPIQFVIAPTLGAAYRATPALTVGGAVNFLYTFLDFSLTQDVGTGSGDDFRSQGKVFVYRRPDGTPVDPPEPFTAGTGRQVTWQEVFDLAAASSGAPDEPPPVVRATLDRVQGAGLAAQVGVLWEPGGDVRLGAGVRSPGFIFRPSGRIAIDLEPTVEAIKRDPAVSTILTPTVETYLPDGGATGFIQRYDFRIDDIRLPLEAVAGIAWSPSPRWLLALDVRYINWAGAFREVKITGRNGSNRDFNEAVGGPDLRYTFKMSWDDQVAVAAGAAFAATERLVLRAGWNHGEGGPPEEFLAGNSLGTRDHATAGATVALGAWDLDLGYVFGLERRSRTTDSATTSEQHIFYLGVGYQF